MIPLICPWWTFSVSYNWGPVVIIHGVHGIWVCQEIDWVLKTFLVVSSHLFIVIMWQQQHEHCRNANTMEHDEKSLQEPQSQIAVTSRQIHFHPCILQAQLDNWAQHHPGNTTAKNLLEITKTFDHSWATVKNQHEIHGHQHFQSRAELLSEWLK